MMNISQALRGLQELQTKRSLAKKDLSDILGRSFGGQLTNTESIKSLKKRKLAFDAELKKDFKTAWLELRATDGEIIELQTKISKANAVNKVNPVIKELAQVNNLVEALSGKKESIFSYGCDEQTMRMLGVKDKIRELISRRAELKSTLAQMNATVEVE